MIFVNRPYMINYQIFTTNYTAKNFENYFAYSINQFGNVS